MKPWMLLLLSGALLSGCGGAPVADEIHEDAGEGAVHVSRNAQTNIGLEIAPVQRRSLERVVTATGIVAPDQTRYAHITPLGRGIVDKVHVNLGDRVRQGEALVSYDNIELGDLIGEYLNLRAGLQKIEAEREVAGKILERSRSLLEVEAIARQEFEVRQAQYDQAVASARSQQAEIARVDEKLHRFGLTDPDITELKTAPHESPHRTASHNVLRAPFSGIIVSYDVSPGELVDRDKALFTLVDTADVWVLGDLYEKDIGRVKSGRKCFVSVASYPAEVFVGDIAYVSDFLDPASRTAKVRCVVPNPEGRLKLEMFADVRIPVEEGREALTVPLAAIQDAGGETVVFVKTGEEEYRKRVVKISERGEDWAEVLEGLDGSETVVAKGSFYLKSILLREEIGDEH